jgi:HSP20 family protein
MVVAINAAMANSAAGQSGIAEFVPELHVGGRGKMVSSFPFGSDFVVLRDAMNQLLEESFIPSRAARNGVNGQMVRSLPLDVFATQDEAFVIAAVPGITAENLDITINQNVVTLAGNLPTAAESEQGKGATWYLHELWHGSFRRSVTLPFEVDATKAEATFDNGIVRITLPKAERAKPFKIAIRTADGQQAIEAESTRAES